MGRGWSGQKNIRPGWSSKLTESGGGGYTATTNTHSVVMNGTDEHITFGNILNKSNTDAFSVSIWYEPSSDSTSSTTDALYGKQNISSDEAGYSLIRVNQILYIVFSNNTAAGERIVLSLAGATSAGVRNHWVVTYDGSSAGSGVTLYKDGVSQTLSTIADNLSGSMSNSGGLMIGARRVTATDFCEGEFDWFSVYNKELSGSEVTELYNSGTAADPREMSFEGNVELSASLGETADDLESADGVVDLSTNETNGTASNMTNAANKVSL